MTIEEKFSSVPCDLLINTEASPYVWRFDPDCFHFFLEEKSEADDLSHYYVETPYRDTDSIFFIWNKETEKVWNKEFNHNDFLGGWSLEEEEMIDKAQYGAFAGHKALGAADYKLACHGQHERGAYTFCMCPGGTVVAATSEKGGVVVNGMSEWARNAENSNSALLVNIDINISKSSIFDNLILSASFNKSLEKSKSPHPIKNVFSPIYPISFRVGG